MGTVKYTYGDHEAMQAHAYTADKLPEHANYTLCREKAKEITLQHYGSNAQRTQTCLTWFEKLIIKFTC